MATVETGDALLHYEWRAGHGPAIVCLHEMGGNLDGWGAVWNAVPAGQAMLRYDMRGCGKSSAGREEATVARHVADLAMLIEAIGITAPLALVGTAVGGAIALAFGATYPDMVGRIMALAPACGVKVDRVEATRALADAVRREGMEKAFLPLAQIGWPASCRRDDGRYAAYVESARATDPIGVAATLDLLAGMELDPLLRKIEAPTLVVGGTHDGLRPREEILRVAGLIDRAEAMFIDSGHFVHVERPELVAELIDTHVLSRADAQ